MHNPETCSATALPGVTVTCQIKALQLPQGRKKCSGTIVFRADAAAAMAMNQIKPLGIENGKNTQQQMSC